MTSCFPGTLGGANPGTRWVLWAVAAPHPLLLPWCSFAASRIRPPYSWAGEVWRQGRDRGSQDTQRQLQGLLPRSSACLTWPDSWASWGCMLPRLCLADGPPFSKKSLRGPPLTFSNLVLWTPEDMESQLPLSNCSVWGGSGNYFPNSRHATSDFFKSHQELKRLLQVALGDLLASSQALKDRGDLALWDSLCTSVTLPLTTHSGSCVSHPPQTRGHFLPISVTLTPGLGSGTK